MYNQEVLCIHGLNFISQLSGQKAFMTGQLKTKGNIMLATKLDAILKVSRARFHLAGAVINFLFTELERWCESEALIFITVYILWHFISTFSGPAAIVGGHFMYSPPCMYVN